MTLTSAPASALAGFASGLRSLLPLAVTLAANRSPWTGLAGTLAAGELVGDKLPFAPPRTQPVVLGGRALTGALCGSLLAKRAGENATAGALLGGIGAIAGTVLGYNARKCLTSELALPDVLVALAEDGITFGLARFANAS